jgi:hypothetical protein
MTFLHNTNKLLLSNNDGSSAISNSLSSSMLFPENYTSEWDVDAR